MYTYIHLDNMARGFLCDIERAGDNMAFKHEVCYSLGGPSKWRKAFSQGLRGWRTEKLEHEGEVLATRSVLYRLQGVDIESLCLEVTGDGV